MASACVNNVIGVPPESFIDCTPSNFPVYGWLGPRISFSREYSDEDASDLFAGEKASPAKKPPAAPEKSDPANDFEFRLDDPSTMLPADELISGGKLVPLQFTSSKTPAAVEATGESIMSPEERRSCARNEAVSIADDPYLFSPKAPRCSSRWRELLGLKKSKQENCSKSTSASTATTSFSSSSSPTKAGKSIRQFLHRTSKSMSLSDASLRLPLLNVPDSESLSISSPHNPDEFPRLSLDSDTKPYLNHPKVRMVKLRMVSVAENPIAPLIDHPSAPAPMNPAAIPRRLSMDSPRMNPSGKIVFESLERSCSSPSSFNGGSRCKHRGVERSYSANVRVAPVLNVPVCSLRGSSKSGVLGFGQLFSSQSKKKEGNGGNQYHRHCNSRLRRTSS